MSVVAHKVATARNGTINAQQGVGPQVHALLNECDSDTAAPPLTQGEDVTMEMY